MFQRNITLLLFYLLIPVFSIAEPIKLPIVNGKIVDPSGTGFVKLYVVKKDGLELFCSGSLIGRSTILTAAHCVTRTSAITVYFEGGKFIRPGLRWWRHPNFRIIKDSEGENALYDLGIVRLSDEVPSSIPVIKISKKKVKVGEILFTYGFGKDETGALGTLKVATTKVGSTKPGQFTVYANSKWGNSLACFGDSGAPVVRQIKKGKVKTIEIVGTNAAADSECKFINDVSPTTSKADLRFISKYLK